MKYTLAALSILHIKWNDLATHAAVTEQSGLDDTREIIKRRRLRLFVRPSSARGSCDFCSLSLLCCKWRHSSSTWLASPNLYWSEPFTF